MATRDEILAQLTSDGPFALGEMEIAGGPIRIYRNAPPSLRDMFLATRAFADRDFLLYESERITYAGAHRQAAALAAHLKEIGVEKGDRVAIGMRNYPEWVISFWACQAIGAVAVALNAWWTPSELEYALEDSGSVVAIVDPERLARLKEIGPKHDLREIIVVRGAADGRNTRPYSDVIGRDVALPDAEIGPEDYATILYTSGTTGRSKGAAATQRNHITNIMNTLLSGEVNRLLAGGAAPPPGFQPGSLQTFPFFHIGGMSGLYVSTVTGSKIALMYKWSPPEAVELIEKHGLTSVAGVPYVVRQLLESARSAGRPLPTLMGMAAGGASVPADLIRTIGKQFSAKVAPGNGYGLTETTSAVIANGGADYFAQPDSVGRPVVTCDAKVVDDAGRELGTGEIGEIWLRGPNVIPGYWKNRKATDEAFVNGWFKSGDLGYRDAEGRYYVVDRKKDVIIRGGENVYCAEVEAALLEHPMVQDAAVLGLPHPELGEIVGAVVQPKASVRAEGLDSDLSAHLAEKIAKFKIPARYVFTPEDLPRTATGKLLKRDMRNKFFQTG